MATTTNYSWTTPDDTALVKDGAAAIRSLGTSIDTTTKNLNPSTTLGDIEYRSSTANTNTRLAIGTTGQVLTVAGGVPSWAAAGGGGANWSLVNAGGTALTGAQTITVSGIADADKIMVVVIGASAGASSGHNFRLNADSGSNYNRAGLAVSAPSTYNTGVVNLVSGINSTSFPFASQSSDAAATIAGYALITGCNASGVKVWQSVGGAAPGTGNGQFGWSLGGWYASASTISSVSIISDSGNYDAGTIYVYKSA